MSLRTSLNTINPGQMADCFRDISIGEFLSYLISIATPTQAGVVPASDIATLANIPTAIFQVNATAAASTGVKKLLYGQITGPSAVVPAAGECVWAGGLTVLFNAVDAVTAASFLYSTAAATGNASILMRNLGQSGNV
jgi:hypothetical protein